MSATDWITHSECLYKKIGLIKLKRVWEDVWAALFFPASQAWVHVYYHFAWRNAKSFYCISPRKKAALRFQCILKSFLQAKTVSELSVGRYTPLHASAERLCMWSCSLTESINECGLIYPAYCKCLAFFVQQDCPGGLENSSYRSCTQGQQTSQSLLLYLRHMVQ